MKEHELIADATIFRGLDDGQLRRIAERGTLRGFSEGEVVVEEGTPGESIFVLVEGRLQVTMELDRPSENVPVNLLAPGDVLGEFALVSDHQRSATARAIRDSRLFELETEAFRELAGEDPLLGYRVLDNTGRILVGRLIKTTRELRASLMF